MNITELQQTAIKAETITNEVKIGEIYKPALFQVILQNLIKERPQSSIEKQPETNPEGENLNNSLTILSNKLGLSKEDLQDIFDFSADGTIRVLTSGLPRESDAKKQQNVVMAYLTVLYCCSGKDRESADLLRQLCQDLGIKDKKNFSRNIEVISNCIKPIGKHKSSQKQYKITSSGREKGIELIKNLVKAGHEDTDRE